MRISFTIATITIVRNSSGDSPASVWNGSIIKLGTERFIKKIDKHVHAIIDEASGRTGSQTPVVK